MISMPVWSLIVGVLLIAMVLVGTVLPRVLLSSAMIYLAVGYGLGPGGIGVINLDPLRHAEVIGQIAEAALLISLFTVGLKMGEVPSVDRRWLLPLRLALVSMTVCVGLITAVGVWWLGLSVGAAILLGGILAPTDPVLAAGVQSHGRADSDSLRFSLAGEGGLNDGTAYPFVLLGLGLLGRHELGHDAWHWWMVDVLWATIGGVAIGAALGALIGALVVRLRTRHRLAVGLDEFLSLGLVAVTYGVAQLCLASAFLAVFAAGLALRRVNELPYEIAGVSTAAPRGAAATHPDHASSAMTSAVKGFNRQLESVAEMAMVLLVGAMLPYAQATSALLWFVPLLFVVLRGVAVLAGTAGAGVPMRERVMLSWFGIRGIGSVFYLMFAIDHGVTGPLAQELISITLVTVAASVVVHGVSAQPMMRWYGRSKPARP